MRVLFLLLIIGFMVFGCSSKNEEKELQNFIDAHVAKIKPLEKESKLAYWQAVTIGSDSIYKKASQLELKIRKIYSNKQDFEYLKNLLKKHKIKDPVLKRELKLLYYKYEQNQIDPDLLKKIVTLSSKIEEEFSTFRPTLNGKKVNNNEILDILKHETDSAKRKAAWEASKQVGQVVADDIIQLAKLRNQAARKLGFKNYHEMALRTNEQFPKKIDDLLWDLGEYSLEPYYNAKVKIDRILAKRYKIDPKAMKPWHYEDPFFQETPSIFNVNLDSFYKGNDVKAIAETFYKSIGLPVDDILAHSDLYERPGKNPHAFEEDIDKDGDVRILCNLENNETWMETILHELGHAVYDKNIDPGLPYLLREPAHIFTTEGIAMMFGRLSRNPYWMQKMLHFKDDERRKIEPILFEYMRLKQLIFIRWTLVMYNFEKRLYQNPDQNLNHLWWRLVKEYQLINPPDNTNRPDWAAKIHFAIAPCYYHNYLLGEVFASQVHHYITHNVLKARDWHKIDYVNRPEVGTYLKDKIFKVGKLYSWNEMIKRATGRPLTTDYYIKQFLMRQQ